MTGATLSDADRAKWDTRYAERGALDEPSEMLVSLVGELPTSGRALDVAGGAGRNSVWLAGRGLDVTAVDVSAVGLSLARERAAAAGVSVATVVADLETDPLPAGPWDLIISFHYLHRPLFDQFPLVLAPGGVLVFVQPTQKNLERHDKPPRRFLLDEGELAGLATRSRCRALRRGMAPQRAP